MMKQVLLFPEHIAPHRDELIGEGQGIASSISDCFLAILHQDLQDHALQSLTSSMMRWSADIWLLDLKPCLSYWLYQIDRSGVSLYEFFRQFLSHLCSGQSYYAAIAADPWQALLLLKNLEEKGIHGLIGRDARIGENLYRDISWSCWWRCCEEYVAASIRQQRSPKHKERQLQQDIRRMELAVKRLGIPRPIQLSELANHQIRRRFGETLAELWNMTFPDSYQTTNKIRNSLKEGSKKSFRTSYGLFPWINHDMKEKPSKKRTLDYPLLEWNHIEVHLCSDLNALCFLDSFKNDHRIISLEWRVVLQDQKQICIIVPFRHPHDLQRDSPHQRTALLQVRYQFEKQLSRVEQNYREIDSPPPLIISWELKVLETLKITPLIPLLFHEDTEEYERLLELENCLPVTLQAFRSTMSWVPEDTYQSSSRQDQKHAPYHDHSPAEQDCLSQVAKYRPLYIYSHPRRFKPTGESGLWKFQERTMDKWWSYYPANHHRNYYQYVSEKRRLWIFQNSASQWYIHGVFA